MLERTASWWRRLTGRTQAASATATLPAADDRRNWVRHPASLRALVWPASDPGSEPYAAEVDDVSQGGVKVVVDKPFELGTLLNVGLTCPQAPAMTLLACVVHCQQGPAGQWAVGCTFSAELNEKDLPGLGIPSFQQLTTDERNQTRYPCNVKATVQLAVEPQAAPWSAAVLNISTSGMALEADLELPTGTLLSAELHGSGDAVPLTILACVVHVTQQAGGGHVIGCNFIRELSDSDLQALV
jgi:hypothetical protein